MKSSTRRVRNLVVSLCYCTFREAFWAAGRILGKVRPGRCMVLCYHGVPTHQVDAFRRQVDAMLRVAKPVRACQREGLPPGALHVAVTFDDAYASTVETAVPELAARGVPCTIFVPTACLGTRPDWADDSTATVATAEQLQSLPAEFVTLGSHTVNHPDLALLDEDSVLRELTESRMALERLAGRPVTLFALPYGREVPNAVEPARRAGYERVFSALPRLTRMNGDDYEVGRVRVDPTDWRPEFRLKLAGGYCWIPAVSRVKRRVTGMGQRRRNGKAVLNGSGVEVEVDQVGPGEWDTVVQRFDDASIYQTHEYEAARWGERRVSHLILREGGRAVAAAQARVVKAPGLPVGVAYVYWGPMWRLRGEEPDPERLRRVLRAIRDEYARRRGLLLRVVPNVFAEGAEDIAALFEAEGFRRAAGAKNYRTLLMDLSPSLEALRKGIRHQWRTNLNKACARTFEIVDGTGDDLYAEFLGLYREMHDRKQFEQHVDVECFREIQRRLPDALKMRTMICRFEGEPVCAVVFSTLGDTALEIFLATSGKCLEVQGAYALLWHQIQWFQEHGVRLFDIGGIDPEANPGGYRFKKGLSGRDVEYIGTFEACRNPVSLAATHAAERLRAALLERRRRKGMASEAQAEAEPPKD